MDTEQIQRERGMFERCLKRRAPGVNFQRLGDSYADADVQLHFDTWLARADLATAGADQDRSRRNEVAVALGLMSDGDFSWEFLIQKIREYTKASGREYALPFRLQR